MTPTQKLYFDNMIPGQTLHTNQARNPADLIAAGKEYIDQGGTITFSNDYSKLTKQNPIPEDGRIHVKLEF